MKRCLFIDLIEGKHDSPKIFESTRCLEIEYIKNGISKSRTDYEIVVIHGHGSNKGNKTVLCNYGECDKNNFDKQNYKNFAMNDFSDMIKDIHEPYILVFLACNSYSNELKSLINGNCKVVIATNSTLVDDSRMEMVLSNLLIPLSNSRGNNFANVTPIVDLFNAEVECEIFRVLTTPDDCV